MKRTFLPLLAVGFVLALGCSNANGAENNDTTNVADVQQTADLVSTDNGDGSTVGEKTYILTEKGVDVLVYEKQLKMQPPTGSVYDQAVKKYVDDYGSTVYTLKRKGKEIGIAAVDGGVVTAFYFSTPDVQTDNGIHPGTLVVEALKKDGVTAIMMYDDMYGEYIIDIDYGSINLITLGTTDLSANGVKKLTDLEKRTKKWESDYSGDQPRVKLGPDDINDIIDIKTIGIGPYYY